MRNVKIYYNPYLESTRLIIDGEERTHGVSRLEEFIVGQPLDKWLSPYVFSYQKWNGFLPELMDDLNDDEVHITFFSLPQYVPRLAEEFDKQTSLIEEKGYSSDLWRCDCEEFFLPKDVRNAFKKFLELNKRFAPNEESMQLFNYAESSLNRSQQRRPDSVEALRKVYECLQKAVETAKIFCETDPTRRKIPGNIRRWENAQSDLLNIFGR